MVVCNYTIAKLKPIPRQLVVVSSYQGIKKREERVEFKRIYSTIFISTALGIKAQGSRKKNCIKIIHHLHVLSDKGGWHRHSEHTTPTRPFSPGPSPTALDVTHIHTVIIKRVHTHS